MHVSEESYFEQISPREVLLPCIRLLQVKLQKELPKLKYYQLSSLTQKKGITGHGNRQAEMGLSDNDFLGSRLPLDKFFFSFLRGHNKAGLGLVILSLNVALQLNFEEESMRSRFINDCFLAKSQPTKPAEPQAHVRFEARLFLCLLGFKEEFHDVLLFPKRMSVHYGLFFSKLLLTKNEKMQFCKSTADSSAASLCSIVKPHHL